MNEKIKELIESFEGYLETDEAKEHLQTMEKEKVEVKELINKLSQMERKSRDFTDLVLYGLLPNAKRVLSKRVSLFPAFMNIRKFFSKYNYSEDEWNLIANRIFKLCLEFQKNPESLASSIKEFTKDNYSRRLQCGSISPILFCLNDKYPIVNNRTRRTYRDITFFLGSEDELSQKLEEYLINIEKITGFIEKIAYEKLKNNDCFDLFCYWYDTRIYSKKTKKSRTKVNKIELSDENSDGIQFEDEGEEEPIPIAPENRKVSFSTSNRRIIDLLHDYKRKDLDPRPSFQRRFVWDNGTASRLIESVFLNVPIPMVYTSEEDDGKEVVIDGQQRLTSFFRFYDGDLKLSGLKVLRELKGKTFAEVDKLLQKSFERYELPIIKISKESNKDVKYEIFERLNTGSKKLNDQEIRNCVFKGKFNDFIRELAEDKDFQYILDYPPLNTRMLDVELILRFFAFQRATYLNFKPPMKKFLNDEIEFRKRIEDKDLKELKEIFKKSVELTKSVFGSKAFRRFIAGTKKDPNGRWELKRFNKSLFDVIMVGFTYYSKNQIYPKIDAIREEIIWLMTDDVDFIDSITLGTQDKKKIHKRFDIWLNALKSIIDYPEEEPRAFAREYKQQLYDTNPTCAICGQHIQTLDDSEVDHVDFYWRGGKTIPSNARLAHRYCNRARGSIDKEKKIEEINLEAEEKTRAPEYNTLIDNLERQLRIFIDSHLNTEKEDYWEECIPPDIKDAVRRRIEDRLKKNPFERKEDYESDIRKLEFCDIMSYSKIILSNFNVFKESLGSTDVAEKHLSSYADFRNAVKHSRVMNEIEEEQGKVSMKWINKVINK